MVMLIIGLFIHISMDALLIILILAIIDVHIYSTQATIAKNQMYINSGHQDYVNI